MNCKLVFSNNPNCFIKLPKQFIQDRNLKEVSGYKIENANKNMFCFWAGEISDDYNVSCNGLFACKQGFVNMEQIYIKELSYLPKCQSIYVEPESLDDWEIIDINSSIIEKIFLNQTRLVFLNQILPIWILPSLMVFIKICKIEPTNNWSLLDNKTEIIISLKTSLPETKLLHSSFVDTKLDSEIKANIFKCRISNIKNILCQKNNDSNIFDQPFNTFLTNYTENNRFKKNICKPFYASLSLFEDTLDNANPNNISTCVVRIFQHIKIGNSDLTLYCSDSVFLFLKIYGPCFVIISVLNNIKNLEIDKLIITSNYNISKNDVFHCLYSMISNDYPLLINNSMTMKISNECSCCIFLQNNYLISKSTSMYFLLDYNMLANVELDMKLSDQSEKIMVEHELNNYKIINTTHLEELKEFLLYCKNLIYNNTYITNTYLICGTNGSGKTFCFQYIFNNFLKLYYINSKYINCTNLKNKPIHLIYKEIMKYYNECSLQQPSFLYLDNLDMIAQKEKDNMLFRNLTIANILINIHNSFTYNNKNKIILIATCQILDNLNHIFDENNFFNKVLYLKNINITKNKFILNHDIKKRIEADLEKSLNNDKIDLLNYSFNDLQNITASFFLYNSCKKFFRTSNIKLNDYLPINDRNQNDNTDSISNLKLPPMGGLNNIYKILHETICFPAKYKKLFSKCPLRIRSGILLYGPSGTGKTLLMKLIVREFKFNHIYVNGPELLNRYIGASEAAVKNLFKKARDMAPCLLLFDEFDSVASKRGCDNTGVTDRVVNQLLLELDGIDSLTDVYIIAATNRPDLIDPALLRPGRIDQNIFCAYPNEDELIDIITNLTNGININMNIQKLAKKCKGLTGADIKSLIYNAIVMEFHNYHELNNFNNIIPVKELTFTFHINEDTLCKCLFEILQSKQNLNDNICAEFNNISLKSHCKIQTFA